MNKKKVLSLFTAVAVVASAYISATFTASAASLSDEALVKLSKEFIQSAKDCGCPIYLAKELEPPKGDFTEPVEKKEAKENKKEAEKKPEAGKEAGKEAEAGKKAGKGTDAVADTEKPMVKLFGYPVTSVPDEVLLAEKKASCKDCDESFKKTLVDFKKNLKETDFYYGHLVYHDVKPVFQNALQLKAEKGERIKAEVDKRNAKDAKEFLVGNGYDKQKEFMEFLAYFEKEKELKAEKSKAATKEKLGVKDKEDAFDVNYIISGEKAITAILDAYKDEKDGLQIMVYPQFAFEEREVSKKIYSTRQLVAESKRKDLKHDWDELLETLPEDGVPYERAFEILFADVSTKAHFQLNQAGKRKYFEFRDGTLEKNYNNAMRSIEDSFDEVRSNDIIHWNYGTVYRKSADGLKKTSDKAMIGTFVLEVKNKDDNNFRKHHTAVVVLFDGNKVKGFEVY